MKNLMSTSSTHKVSDEQQKPCFGHFSKTGYLIHVLSLIWISAFI